jgi:uncharacterized protein (TIGR02145 family)
MKTTKTNDVHPLSPFGGRGALFFLFFLPLWGSGSLFGGFAFAQSSTVQVTPLSATYTSPAAIQFSVSWTNQSATHLPKVWVIADYRLIENNAPAGNWQPATITGTVQKTAGTVSQQSARGFFLEGGATNFSSTVTVHLSGIPANAQFNWCVYALDYPPNVTGATSFSFKGTLPFIVQYSDGSTYSVSAKTGYAPQSGKTFTAVVSDGTGYPGGCIAPGGISTFADFAPCPGVANASTWTLTDTRDSRKYRVVKMPDGRIWMGQNLNYRGVTYKCLNDVAANCEHERGAYYSHAVAHATGFCPSGWHVPSRSEWGKMLDAVEGSGHAHENATTDGYYGVRAGARLKSSTGWSAANRENSPYTDTFNLLISYYYRLPPLWNYIETNSLLWSYNPAEINDRLIDDNSKNIRLGITDTGYGAMMPARCIQN